MQVILDSSFARLGSAPIWGGKKGEFRDWTNRADDLCRNLICEYFCWMLGDPHFFFGRSLPFLIFPIILKNKKKSVRGNL